MVEQNKIGSKIRLYREMNGFSQEYISMLIGISQSAYSKIEAGTTDLTVNRLIKICIALNCSINELVVLDQTLIKIKSSINENASSCDLGSHLSDKISNIQNEITFIKALVLELKLSS